MRRLIVILTLALFAVNCGSKDGSSEDAKFSADNILLYEEGDTLQMDILPKSIKDWVNFYHQLDTSFNIGRFKSSGVNLHLAELSDAISKGNEQSFKNVFFYSPDKSKYVDLFSYNYFLDKGKYVTGEVDQQVVLGNITEKKRKQLMYFGPSQLAESAGWLSDNSFMLAITERTEDRKIKAEIFLFNLKDSLYTNFQLDHLIPAETAIHKNVKFPETYLNKTNL